LGSRKYRRKADSQTPHSQTRVRMPGKTFPSRTRRAPARPESLSTFNHPTRPSDKTGVNPTKSDQKNKFFSKAYSTCVKKEILKRDRSAAICICRVSIDVIIGLRHRLLRAGLPIEAAQFPGDDDASTWHVGVFTSGEENGAPLSCASFMLNSYKDEPAWQLRGMATDSGQQGKGFGGKLLACAEAEIVKESNVRLFWCNARVPALRFYERHGWKVDSEEFDIPTAGPHRRMVKRV
jgi:GNAT superfamily N-acetyltransferase